MTVIKTTDCGQLAVVNDNSNNVSRGNNMTVNVNSGGCGCGCSSCNQLPGQTVDGEVVGQYPTTLTDPSGTVPTGMTGSKPAPQLPPGSGPNGSSPDPATDGTQDKHIILPSPQCVVDVPPGTQLLLPLTLSKDPNVKQWDEDLAPLIKDVIAKTGGGNGTPISANINIKGLSFQGQLEVGGRTLGLNPVISINGNEVDHKDTSDTFPIVDAVVSPVFLNRRWNADVSVDLRNPVRFQATYVIGQIVPPFSLVFAPLGDNDLNKPNWMKVCVTDYIVNQNTSTGYGGGGLDTNMNTKPLKNPDGTDSCIWPLPVQLDYRTYAATWWPNGYPTTAANNANTLQPAPCFVEGWGVYNIDNNGNVDNSLLVYVIPTPGGDTKIIFPKIRVEQGSAGKTLQVILYGEITQTGFAGDGISFHGATDAGTRSAWTNQSIFAPSRNANFAYIWTANIPITDNTTFTDSLSAKLSGNWAITAWEAKLI